jgi:hypothetical protein
MLGSFYKTIAVSDENVDADLADFPLLVAIDGDAQIGAHAKADGSDLRFALPDQTLLKYEIEQFGIAGGLATGRIWVKVPLVLASGGATLRCYYGNPAAADGQDPPSVWDSGFKGVWHLHDDLLNSVTGVAATDTGTVGFSAAKVGNGREGDGGTGDGLTTDIAGLGAGAIHTLEGWAVNHTFSGTGYYGIFGSRQWQRSVALSTTNVPNGNWMLNVGSQEGVQPGGGPTLGQWYHYALVLDGSNARFYVNGTQVGPDYAYTWAGENTTPLRLLANQYANNGLDGCLDEARYSQVARSVEWVKFEVANIVNAGNEQVWGPEQLAAPVPWHLMLQGAV